MQQTERENFLKNAITIVDYTKDAFVCLVDRYLIDKNWTFEQFLSNNQHEIYHLCYSARCCKCPSGYSPPKRRVLHPSQLDVLFDKLSKLPSCKNASEFCCTKVKNGISSIVLDLSLARCLLINFCLDIFWYSCLQFQNQNLEEFLNQNKHNLYHLWQYNVMCCQCLAGYISPATRPIIDHIEWNLMFTTTSIPCKTHRKRGSTNYVCSVSATSGISLSQLTPDLQEVIIQYCCDLKKTVDKLVEIRNHDYGHAKEGKMSNTEYAKCKTELQAGILGIAKVCNKEEDFKQKLESVQKRSLDENLCRQYQNALLEFLNMQKETNDDISELGSELGSRLDIIHGKIVSKTKNIPIAIAAKQQKIMDDSMSHMGTSVAETIERGNQKNIKMFECMQNQLGELIPKKLKKCSKQSGQSRTIIDHHLKDESFVATEALDQCLSELSKYKVLIITGEQGCGKTEIGLEILCKCRQLNENCDVVIISNLSEVRRAIFTENSEDGIVLLMDNVFGKTKNTYDEDKHELSLNILNAYVNGGNLTVIFIIREKIFQSIQHMINSHGLFRDHAHVNLNSDKSKLTKIEKTTILLNYCKKNKIEFSEELSKERYEDEGILNNSTPVILHRSKLTTMINSEPEIGFLKACVLFTTRRKFTRLGLQLFMYPTMDMISKIDSLRTLGGTNMRDRLSYVILVYIMLNNNRLAKHEVNLRKVRLRAIEHSCYGIRSITHTSSSARDVLEHLNGIYLKYNGESAEYEYKHQHILDCVFISYGHIATKEVIPLLEISFIENVIKPENYNAKEEEISLTVPKRFYRCLTRRIRNILKDNCTPPFRFLESFVASTFMKQNDVHFFSLLIDEFDDFNSNDIMTIQCEGKQRDVAFCFPVALLYFSVQHKCTPEQVKLCLESKIILNANSCRFLLLKSFEILCINGTGTAILSMLWDTINNLGISCNIMFNIHMCLKHKRKQMSQWLLDQQSCKTNIAQYIADVLCNERPCFSPPNEHKIAHLKWVVENISLPDVQEMIQIICNTDFKDIICILLPTFSQRQLDFSTIILSACQKGWYDVVKWLIDIVKEIEHLNSLILAACKFHWDDILDILLNNRKLNFAIENECSFNTFEIAISLMDYDYTRFKFVVKEELIKEDCFPTFVGWVFQNFPKHLPCKDSSNENFVRTMTMLKSITEDYMTLCSALVTAVKYIGRKAELCKFVRSNIVYYYSHSSKKLICEIVKFIMHNTKMDQFDLHNACTEAVLSVNFKILRIIWQNIDHKHYNVDKLISGMIWTYNESVGCYLENFEAEMTFVLCNTNSQNSNWILTIKSALKTGASEILKWIVQNLQFDQFEIAAIVNMLFNKPFYLQNINFLFEIESKEKVNVKRLITRQSMKNLYRLLSSCPQKYVFALLANIKDELEISDKKTLLRTVVQLKSSELFGYISFLELPIDILNTQYFIQSAWLHGCYHFINYLLNKNVKLLNILNVAENYKCHHPSDGMVEVMTCVLKGCDYSSANIRSIIENLLHHHERIDAKTLSRFLQLLLEKTQNLAGISSPFFVTLTLIYTNCISTVQKMVEIANEDIDKPLFILALFKSASRQINISMETYTEMLRFVLNSSKNSVEIDIMNIFDLALQKVNFSRKETFELLKCLLQNVDNALIDSRLLILSVIRSVINSSKDLTIYTNLLQFLLVQFDCSTTDITNGIKLIFSEQQLLCTNCMHCVMFLINKSNYNSQDIEELISFIIKQLQNLVSYEAIIPVCELLKNMLDNPNLNANNIDFFPFISICAKRYCVFRENRSDSVFDVIKLILINVKLTVKDVTKFVFEKSDYVFYYFYEINIEFMELLLKHFSLSEINTLMTEACHHGDEKLVCYLLSKQKNQLDINAAFCACMSENVRVANVLYHNFEIIDVVQKSAVDKFLNSDTNNSEMLLWILQNIESKNIDIQKAMALACLRTDFQSVKCIWDKEDRTLFNTENIAEEENVSQILVIAFANQDLSIIDDLSKKIDLQAFAIKEELLTKLIRLPYESDMIVWLVRNIHLRLSQIRILFNYAIRNQDIQCVRAVADKSYKRKIDITYSLIDVNCFVYNIKWFLNNCRFAFSMIDMKKLMYFTCKTSLEIVKCILENIDQTEFDMTKCLIMASYTYSENEDIYDWLIQNVDHDKFDFTIAVIKIHDPECLQSILNDVDLECIDIESLLITTYKCGRFDKICWLLQETPISSITYKVPMCSLMQIDREKVTSFDNAEEGNVITDSDYEYDCSLLSDNDSDFDDQDDIDMFFCENYNNSIERNDSSERSVYSQNESNKKEQIAYLHLLKNTMLENSDFDIIIKEMSRRGWLRVLQWIFECTPESFNAQIVMYEACRNGRKKIVKWLLIHVGKFNLDLRVVMKESCGYGWIDIVIWLWETTDHNIFNMAEPLQEACEYGRLNVVRWVTDNVPKENINAQTLMNAACKNSWKDIIVWVFKHFDSIFYDIGRALKEACAFDALEIVQLIHKHHPFNKNMAAEAMNESLQNKSENCKGEVAMFLFQNFNADNFNTEIILMKACEYGWVALVKKIFENGIDNTIDISKAFHLACMNGETQIVDIIICNGNPRQIDLDSAMVDICSHGWDEILNLIMIRRNIPHELFDMEKAFNTACEFGQLEIVEILSENVDVKLLNLETAMIKACRSRMNERLVRFLLDKFDNEKFEMDKVTFAVQEYGWQDITKTYTDSVQIW